MKLSQLAWLISALWCTDVGAQPERLAGHMLPDEASHIILCDLEVLEIEPVDHGEQTYHFHCRSQVLLKGKAAPKNVSVKARDVGQFPHGASITATQDTQLVLFLKSENDSNFSFASNDPEHMLLRLAVPLQTDGVKALADLVLALLESENRYDRETGLMLAGSVVSSDVESALERLSRSDTVLERDSAVVAMKRLKQRRLDSIEAPRNAANTISNVIAAWQRAWNLSDWEGVMCLYAPESIVSKSWACPGPARDELIQALLQQRAKGDVESVELRNLKIHDGTASARLVLRLSDKSEQKHKIVLQYLPKHTRDGWLITSIGFLQ